MCLFPVIVGRNVYPCQHCVECRQAKSQEWAFRCMLEASAHKESCMISLTYNEDNLPKEGTLVKRDLQNFVKRLRKSLSKKGISIRYFASGEYGDQKGRPHYHIIIFGWKPSDLWLYFISKDGVNTYRSNFVEKHWKLGFSTVVNVEMSTTKYVALYLQKVPEKNKKVVKPFQLMSKRPGIGVLGLTSKVLETGKLYINGNYIKLPRYFLDWFDREGFNTEPLRAIRREKSSLDIYTKHNNELICGYFDRSTGKYIPTLLIDEVDKLQYLKDIDKRREKVRLKLGVVNLDERFFEKHLTTDVGKSILIKKAVRKNS